MSINIINTLRKVRGKCSFNGLKSSYDGVKSSFNGLSIMLPETRNNYRCGSSVMKIFCRRCRPLYHVFKNLISSLLMASFMMMGMTKFAANVHLLT